MDKQITCVCCSTDHPLVTMTHTQYGILCMFCFGGMYYDGWYRRETPLTLEELRDYRQAEKKNDQKRAY
jgi:hypothetical protein